MRQKSKRIGISFEMRKIGPLRFGHILLQHSSGTFAEKSRYGFFSRVTERRIAQIMGKTCSSDYLVKSIEFAAPRLVGILCRKSRTYFVSKRSAYRRDLHRVCQSIVNKHTARQRKHLRLVLQTTKRRRKHKPVEIALEIAA